MAELREKLRAVPVTTALIGVCVAVFAVQYVLLNAGRGELIGLLALSKAGLAHGQWWTLVTYLFVHANLMHLVANVLGLWFIGPEVERMLGRARYLVLYFASGVGGGILQTAFAAPTSELVGASGAVCGVLLSFTTAYPDMRLRALLFFILPVNMKAKTLGRGLIVLSAVCAALHLIPQLGHLAHLGGALVGAFLTKLWMSKIARRQFYGAPIPGRSAVSTEDVLRRMAEEGLEGLSDAERRRLEQWTEKHPPRRW